MQTPKRSGESDLSDDELLLFDMMFDCGASKSRLSSSVYGEHMNCGYKHSLDDAALSQAIDSLLARQLIRPIGDTVDSPETWYTLSEAGGRLWEVERKPDWQRYLTTCEKDLGAFPSGSIVAMCSEELIGRLCLGAMFASGLITPIGRIRGRVLYERRLVPWKLFPVVFALRCRIADNIHHQNASHWDVYESSRCWWRTVNELATLHP